MNLRTARRIARLTQEQLADLAGVKQATISQIENGEVTRPEYTTVARLARALNISPEELFPLQSDSPR